MTKLFMADNEDFLKKVYDRYLGSDYEWGDADLNPKREIQKSDAEQWEEDQKAIIDRIAARVKELAAQAASLPKYKEPEVVDNDNFVTESSGIGGNADPNPDYNESELELKLATGGNPDSPHLIIPNGDPDPQIDFLIGEIGDVIMPLLIPWTGSLNAPGNITDVSIQMSNPGCDDVVDDTSIDLDAAAAANANNSSSTNNSSSSSSSSDSGDDDNNSDDNDNSNNGSSSKTTSEAADAAAEDAVNASTSEALARSQDIAECIATELGILQAILALLKVVSALRKSLLLIMSIMVPIVKMIAFAAQCWINPPAASEVVQMVAEKIAALLISAIGEVLQMIWNMLDLDCKTEMVQSVLDQINETLSGVNSLMNSTKSLISFAKNQAVATAQSLSDSYQKFKQTSQWEEAWEDLKDSTQWDNLKKVQKSAVNEALFNGQGLSKEGISAALSTVLPSDMKNALNSLLTSSKDITNEANDMFTNMGLQDTSLAQKLTDMTDFLGPLKIK